MTSRACWGERLKNAHDAVGQKLEFLRNRAGSLIATPDPHDPRAKAQRYDTAVTEMRVETTERPAGRRQIADPDELARHSADPEGLRRYLLSLRGVPLDESFVARVDKYIETLIPNARIVATTRTDRRPTENEVVITFGNYGASFENLFINNPVRRGLTDVLALNDRISAFECDPCWQPIDEIIVINRKDRPDRYYSCLRELARMEGPLDRITRLNAHFLQHIEDRQLRGQIGALKSHRDAVRRARAECHVHTLILEDDFGFTDDIESNKSDLALFLNREYAYDICLLATSKHGRVEPKDDLVCLTRQPVTNAAAYLVSGVGLPKLDACFSDALEKLIETGDHATYAVDRCWSVLQGDGFLTFNRRLGFQLPSFSDIEGRIVDYRD